MVGARVFAFGMVAVALGCSSKPATKPIIELGELTVRYDGNPIARLHADGRTESVGKNKPGKDAVFTAGPTLHADGTIDLPRRGLTARVTLDGEFVIGGAQGSAHPSPRYGKITGAELVLEGAPTSGVRIDGTTIETFQDGKRLDVLGEIEPPTMARTAVILTAAFFIDNADTTAK